MYARNSLSCLSTSAGTDTKFDAGRLHGLAGGSGIDLALYVALRPEAPGAMLVALSAGLLGITLYLATTQAFTMLTLSKKYAMAATDMERTVLAAAGEAALATHNPGTLVQGFGIQLAFFLVVGAGLIVSLVMWRSVLFNKFTAVMGLLANGLALATLPVLILWPGLIWLPHSLAAPFRLIWYVLIAVKLFQLAGQANHRS